MEAAAKVPWASGGAAAGVGAWGGPSIAPQHLGICLGQGCGCSGEATASGSGGVAAVGRGVWGGSKVPQHPRCPQNHSEHSARRPRPSSISPLGMRQP